MPNLSKNSGVTFFENTKPLANTSGLYIRIRLSYARTNWRAQGIVAILTWMLVFILFGSNSFQANASPLLAIKPGSYTVKYIAPETQVLTEPMKTAIYKSLEAWNLAPPENNTFSVISLRWEKKWAIATISSADLEKPVPQDSHTNLDSGEMVTLLLVQTSPNWEAAIASDSSVQKLLKLIPETELSKEARQVLFPGTNQPPTRTAQSYNNYHFPWRPGTHAYVTQGWHNGAAWGFLDNHSIDFDINSGVGGGSGNGDLVAAAAGTVIKKCSDTNNVFLKIQTDGTGEALGYLHLDPNSLPFKNGQRLGEGHHVEQGEFIGIPKEGAFSNITCGSSTGSHLHLFFPSKPFTIDCVNFTETNAHYHEVLYAYPAGCTSNRSPEGYFDEANQTYLRGWAWDPDRPNTPIDIHIYKDGDSSSGTYIGSYKADQFRQDIKDTRGDNGYHGFELFLPDSLGDGGSHSIYIYAIDPAGQGPNPLLVYSPRTITGAISIGRNSSYPGRYQEAYRRLDLSKDGRPGQATDIVRPFGDGSSGVKWQPLTGGVGGNGAIFLQESNVTVPDCMRAYALDGGIYAEYMRQGGPGSNLGAPTSDAFIEPEGRKWRVAFANGYITDNGNGTFTKTFFETTGSNWRREFRNNTCLSGGNAWVDYVVSSVNFDHNWGEGSTYPAVFNDYYSAIYTRKLNFNGGFYKITIGSDDGFTLYIDGVAVLSRWEPRAYTVNSWEGNITAGNHTVSITYFEVNGPARLTFNLEELTVGVHRFYKLDSGTHFYTSNTSEKDWLIKDWSHLYKYEGVAFSVFPATRSGLAPVYRFYNTQKQNHLYTNNETEKNALIKDWSHLYKYEGIVFYTYASLSSGTSPVYRFYNREKGSHFFTINQTEKDQLIANWSHIYQYEGEAFYAYKPN